MIKTLRTRFILVAMLCMVGVMAIIVTAINLTNYSKTLDTAYQTVDFLLEENNRLQEFPPNQPPAEEEQSRNQHSQGKHEAVRDETPPEEPPQPPDREHKEFSPEKPFSSRYFTVVLDETGAVSQTNVEQIASVDQSAAETMALAVFSQNKTQGVTKPYVFKQKTTEQGILYLFLNCEDNFASFSTYLWISLGISFGGMALVFVLVWFFSGMVMKPVAESYEKQKRFITDAGHELKTPLTIIDANAEVLEMEKGESPWINSIRNQVNRLGDLTQKLVFLSRMEEEEKPITFTEFSLTDAVTETAQPFETVASAHGKTLEISCKKGVTYKGDEATIRQLISLLLDNALKYSSEKGNIAVTLTENGKKKQITVTNTVEKIGSASPSLWFDRFYRQETSRNSATGGHGIGLSVAQAIVNAHKGKISAAYQNGNQVAITVVL